MEKTTINPEDETEPTLYPRCSRGSCEECINAEWCWQHQEDEED